MARRRKKMERPIQVSEILGKSSSKIGFGDRAPLIEIEKNWEKILGPAVSRNCRPLKISGKLLTIGVSHPSWMQELIFLKLKIIEHINLHLNRKKISDIRFEIVKIAIDKEKEVEEKRPLRELTNDENEFIDIAADQIDDTEIKEIAKRMMERDFKKKPNS